MVLALALTQGLCAGTAVALASAPASAQGSASTGPQGRAFTSILVRQDGKPRALVPGTTIKLSFTKDRVVASAGCNTMGGPVVITDDTIVVGDLAATAMACDPSRTKQDAWLAAFLMADPYWSFGDSVLTLRTADIEIMLGEQLPAIVDQPLFNRHWIVDTVLGDRVMYPVPPNIHVSLLFQAAQGGAASMTGILICNRLTATVTVRGDTITADAIGMTKCATTCATKCACDPDDPRVNTGVLTALQGTSTFWIEGNQLTIAKPTGPGLIMHAAF